MVLFLTLEILFKKYITEKKSIKTKEIAINTESQAS
jgi:hypothetical protein